MAFVFICSNVQKNISRHLVFNGKEVLKTHNISVILKDCIKLDPSFSFLKDINIEILTSYATDLRYPDDFYMPSLEETNKSLELAEKTKEFVLKKLIERGYVGYSQTT